jgi:hypothetical protein
MSAPRSRARQRAPGRGLVWASPSLAASSLPLAKPSSCGAGRGAAPPGGESAGRLSLVGPRCRWRRAATASRAGLGCHAPVARGHRGRWTSDGGRGSAPPPAPSAARAPTGSQRSSALPQKRSSRARKKKGRRGGGLVQRAWRFSASFVFGQLSEPAVSLTHVQHVALGVAALEDGHARRAQPPQALQARQHGLRRWGVSVHARDIGHVARAEESWAPP